MKNYDLPNSVHHYRKYRHFAFQVVLLHKIKLEEQKKDIR